ncbi:thymidylate synthase [Micromonospora wenchangensis]|uniref:thymidylate synthase n=1 Tax=Micromonospora wenchangensis TaxID=1185415 RepID=UPI003D73C006
MRKAIERVLSRGGKADPTRGPVVELCNVGLELTNPRARLSRSEGRGRIFSCLGELCWYLSGSNSVDPIAYYISAYQGESEDGVVHGGYGARLFGWDGADQIRNVIRLLQEKPSSRRAVIQLFDHEDINAPHKEVPCTCTMQFMLRDKKLDLTTYMRSNDVYLGLPHDIFSFTMIQELVARSLGASLGAYTHFVGNLHLYDRNEEQVRSFLKEGWQSTKTYMPEMPEGDQWENVRLLLSFEEAVRQGSVTCEVPTSLDPYWADIARLLQIHALSKRKNLSEVREVQQMMNSSQYQLYVDSRLQKG